MNSQQCNLLSHVIGNPNQKCTTYDTYNGTIAIKRKGLVMIFIIEIIISTNLLDEIYHTGCKGIGDQGTTSLGTALTKSVDPRLTLELDARRSHLLKYQ